MSQSFGKKEKLKGKTAIKILFEQGKSIRKFPVQLIYSPLPNIQNHQVAVSVPKRNFKKATDRNRLKRQMRESYRLNKHLVKNSTEYYGMMFIYTAKEKKDFDCIFTSVQQLLEEFSKKTES